MSELSKLEPKAVFHYFGEISGVPRESAHEEKIADYLVRFAQQRGLSFYRDAANNVIIRKPATPGYENAPGLILQGHSDMVCVSEPGYEHDFANDGLALYLEGDRLMARGTTLGADDGISMAYGLAILDSTDIPHPALEAVFTAGEELGMVGAQQLDMSQIKGKTMISFDSGGFTEGRIYVGCAGHQRATVKQSIEYEKGCTGSLCSIRIHGLRGGHSGGEIEKGRANAGRCMARLIYALMAEAGARLVDIHSGDPNSHIKMIITDMARADVLVSDPCAARAIAGRFAADFKQEFAQTDPGFTLDFEEKGPYNGRAFNREAGWKLVRFVCAAPCGVNSMHKFFTDTPESSDNLGVYEIENGCVVYYFSIRSSKESLIEELMNRIGILAGLVGFELEKGKRMCGWEYDPDSNIRNLTQRLYVERYGKEPRFKITHASTECGLFKKGIPELDVLSIGPIIYEEHTYNEYMGVSSVKALWEFLLDIIANLKA